METEWDLNRRQGAVNGTQLQSRQEFGSRSDGTKEYLHQGQSSTTARGPSPKPSFHVTNPSRTEGFTFSGSDYAAANVEREAGFNQSGSAGTLASSTHSGLAADPMRRPSHSSFASTASSYSQQPTSHLNGAARGQSTNEEDFDFAAAYQYANSTRSSMTNSYVQHPSLTQNGTSAASPPKFSQQTSPSGAIASRHAFAASNANANLSHRPNRSLSSTGGYEQAVGDSRSQPAAGGGTAYGHSHSYSLSRPIPTAYPAPSAAARGQLARAQTQSSNATGTTGRDSTIYVLNDGTLVRSDSGSAIPESRNDTPPDGVLNPNFVFAPPANAAWHQNSRSNGATPPPLQRQETQLTMPSVNFRVAANQKNAGFASPAGWSDSDDDNDQDDRNGNSFVMSNASNPSPQQRRQDLKKAAKQEKKKKKDEKNGKGHNKQAPSTMGSGYLVGGFMTRDPSTWLWWWTALVQSSWISWIYLMIVLLESGVNIVIESILLSRFNQQKSIQVDVAKEKALPVFLLVFGAAHVYQIILSVDAVVNKNTILVIGMVISNACILIYSAIQIGEIRDVLGTGVIANSGQHIPVQVLTGLIPAAVGIAEAAYIVLSWYLWKEFGWRIYKQIGADRGLKKRYLHYQIYVALLSEY